MVGQLILASASPRRVELLRQIGIEPVVSPVHVDEDSIDPRELLKTGTSPERLPAVVALARCRLKMDAAHAVTEGENGAGLILAADTVVAADGRILDKPTDREEAREMMTLLSGRTHGVYTAVIISQHPAGRSLEEVAHTRVTFGTLTPGETGWYLDTDEWRGVAGGYRIQGHAAAFVERIEGTYSTVMGLPINTVYSMIKRLST